MGVTSVYASATWKRASRHSWNSPGSPPSYDFFIYYFTLAITPMMLASGVFFALERLPEWLQAVAFYFALLLARRRLLS
jgi:hypothetical protein